MSRDLVCVLFSTYNSADYVGDCLESCLKQNYPALQVIIADDGSTDNTLEVLREKADERVTLIPLPHGERGIARKTAIDRAREEGAAYLYIIDSDMILKENLILDCVDYLEENDSVGGLIIPEIAWSAHGNYYSRVKVFERNIINNAGEDPGRNSIEAARFWKMNEYLSTGGINPTQIAFEETQPTIRYREKGGIIKRAVFTGVHHNEKRVTLKDLLRKKKYYFSQMDKTLQSESEGFRKALSRWYFFRPVLYRRQNLLSYLKHPFLAWGMFFMYFLLSFSAVTALIGSRRGGENL
ncbi:MAG: glycosyltransferase family 2 protein [Spirochaetales bacterium]|nr:glycosyltransferase family 2 protein [Spirochaetales bacterium]